MMSPSICCILNVVTSSRTAMKEYSDWLRKLLSYGGCGIRLLCINRMLHQEIRVIRKLLLDL